MIKMLDSSTNSLHFHFHFNLFLSLTILIPKSLLYIQHIVCSVEI
jgi:hypothetical protein